MDPRWMKHQEMQDRVLPWGPFNVLLSIKEDLEYASESNRSFPVFEGFFELTHAVLFVNIGTHAGSVRDGLTYWRLVWERVIWANSEPAMTLELPSDSKAEEEQS
jgi:hypothetical protein